MHETLAEDRLYSYWKSAELNPQTWTGESLMATSLRKTYQLKISLKGAKPPIWRRLLIADSVSLPQLHQAIQIAMGWTDSHLHQFVVGRERYGVPDQDFDDMDTVDERRVKLAQIMTGEKDSILYEYDFGDGWEHKITLEKILPFDPKAVLPRCVTGKGACPPEDVGGIWGYAEFLKAIGDPSHPEHESYVEWVGGEFDPQLFDIDEKNALLSEYCR
jgi:hypothetical protein